MDKGNRAQFPACNLLAVTVVDNNRVISSKSAGGPMTMILPSTTAISIGWSVAFAPDAGNAITVSVNGVSGGTILVGSIVSTNYAVPVGPGPTTLQFDGTNFRSLSQLTPFVKGNSPSVVLFGAACNSNGTNANGTDDSAAFVQADAAGFGWTIPANLSCRIGSTRSFAGPATISGQMVVDVGQTVTFSGTMNSYGRNPFPIAGTIAIGYNSNPGLVGNTVTTIWGPWTLPGPIQTSDSPFGTPAAQLGDMMGAQALTTTGSISVYRQFLWGYGNSAVGLGVTAGASPSQPECIEGNLGVDPSTTGWYPEQGTVALCAMNFGTPAWLYRVPGTVSGNVFTPTSPFTAAQLAKFHQYETVDTSLDTPPCAGPITSWNPTSVTVQGWYVGNAFGPRPAVSCTPASTNTLTIRATTVYGANVLAQRNSNSQQVRTVGAEVDFVNNSGIGDTQPDNGGYLNNFATNGLNESPSDIGLLVVGQGNAALSAGIVIGSAPTMFDGILVQSPISVAAFHASPVNATIGNAFMADDNYSVYPGNRIGNAFTAIAAIHTVYSTDRAKNPSFAVDYEGNMDVGTQLLNGSSAVSGTLPPPPPPAANSPLWRFYSSASSTLTASNPDSTMQFSGGTGILDGTITIKAGSIVIPLPGSCTGKPAGTFFVSGGFVKQC